MSLKFLTKDELERKIAVIVGTRPGIIKFSPVIKELAARKADFFIIHTGQHYSFNMDRAFFEDLELPLPKYLNEHVRDCKYHGEQTAEMIRGVEQALLQEKPRVVIVGGDANTNLAGALAARKLGITLAHMEAGLRSGDWSMPEEHNRVMIDHISDILLTPTEGTKKNLEEDNVKGKIFVTGNTIVDAVKVHAALADKKSNILNEHSLEPKKFFLVTFHREENVDTKERMKNFVECIARLTTQYPYPVIFPVHPRTIARAKYFNVYDELMKIQGLKMLEAVGYLDFQKLLANTLLVLTDSGGIQEEACIIKVPCVTLRENTERPETVEVGANIIASTVSDKIIKAIESFIDDSVKKDWEQPFGEDCAVKIVDVLIKELEEVER